MGKGKFLVEHWVCGLREMPFIQEYIRVFCQALLHIARIIPVAALPVPDFIDYSPYRHAFKSIKEMQWPVTLPFAYDFCRCPIVYPYFRKISFDVSLFRRQRVDHEELAGLPEA